jgi:hypothetical protein
MEDLKTEQAVIQPITQPNPETAIRIPFGDKLPKRNLIVIAILVVITIILLTFSLFQPAPAVKQSVLIPTPTLAPYVQSGLSLTVPQKNSNGNYFSNVEISTAENQVTGVQIDLSYDPKILTNVEIATGTFFTNPTVLLKKIDTVKGIVSYTLFADQNPKSASGKGTVATLTFSVIPGTKTAFTKINFLPTTEAVGLGQFESVLKQTTGTNLTVK